MANAKFRFISEAEGGDRFKVIGFTGNEAISTLYRYEIEVQAPLSADIKLDEVLESPAHFEIEIDGRVSPIFGMLASFDETRTAQDTVYYRAVLVPRLWQLSIYKTNEIYTEEKTVDKIIETVLTNAGFDSAQFDLGGLNGGNFLVRDYVCQFGESDFDFISRLMENEGIFYYFEHGEGPSEKIVFLNDMHYLEIPRPDLIYDVAAQASRQYDCIDAWSCRKQLLPAGVTVRDFNPERPSQDIADTHSIDSTGQGTEYIYGCNVTSVDEASYLSAIRAEEQLCTKTRYYGESSVTRLQSGHLFALDGHPNEAYNGQEYLVVEVSHEGQHLDMALADEAKKSDRSGPQYRNSFVAIASTQQYRPPRITPKPRFYGTMTAFVFAEAGSMNAEVDEQGRYRVHLPFDRADGTLLSTDPERKASTWIRMAQPYVGPEQGMYYPLPGDTEVLLTFINGDPDQPIIAGAVPNASQPSLLTSETNFQRTITAQPSQTVTGNRHTVSRNSARLARRNEPPQAKHPTGYEPAARPFTTLSASAVTQDYTSDKASPPSAIPIYINDDKRMPPPVSMIPPWEGLWVDTTELAAYDEDLVKFKKYGHDLSAGTMHSNDIKDDIDDAVVNGVDLDDLEVVSTERAGGDNYVYTNGRTFAYPQHERVYFIGTFHEDFHVRDDFMDESKSWTGVKEQFSFPPPGGKFPEGKTPEKNTDIEVNEDGIRGVSEDKRWGDQMTYAWGRSFNWSAGPGDCDSFVETNYGNGTTVNLIDENDGVLADHLKLKDDLAAEHRPDRGDDSKPDGWYSDRARWDMYRKEDKAPAAVGRSPGAVPNPYSPRNYKKKFLKNGDKNVNAAYEFTLGNTYGYQRGDSLDVKVGESDSWTWGDTRDYVHGHACSWVEGDSRSDVLGSTTDMLAGNANSLTIGLTTEMFLGGIASLTVAAKAEVALAGGIEVALGPMFSFDPHTTEIQTSAMKAKANALENTVNEIKSTQVDIQNKLTYMQNTQVVLKNRTVTLVKNQTALELAVLKLQG